MDRRAGARGRRPGDWERDLAGARAGEAALGALLAAEPRVNELTDHTAGVDTLDFRFTYRGGEVWLDLKEKRRAYSPGVADLWPEVAPSDLFIVDELVYRRVVWQGGGGYLAVHDLPGRRSALFGPWELTLGPRRRYERWGERQAGRRFAKGKLLLDLTAAGHLAEELRVDDLLRLVDRSRAGLSSVRAVASGARGLPQLG